MHIKTMLLRLQGALGQDDLIEEMMLLPGLASTPDQANQTTNLIVGYNGSPNSQTALDLALGVAHQTRLATRSQITVQVVYVVDHSRVNHCISGFDFIPVNNHSSLCQLSGELMRQPDLISQPASTRPDTCTLVSSRLITSTDPCFAPADYPATDPLEQADRVLWQARCLADAWRGSLKAHLRFGTVSSELRKVAESEAAALLFLGCDSVKHPVVQGFGSGFPYPVLGIPIAISSAAQSESVI